MDARYHLRDDTQTTDDPQGSPCAWCILLTPLGLIPRKSWFRVVPRHSMAWLNWIPYLQYVWNIERERTRFPEIWERVLFLAVLWAARSVASFEEIWDAVAGSGSYSQTSLPFWRDMTGCIAIGSLATAVDWLVSFTLHEPITCSYICVIEKGFSEGEKRDFSILTVFIPISRIRCVFAF